ncbi:DNA-(apurinic or apyrimidinic site) lyase / pyrimidine dimer DNA glycosylase [Arthrobacter crystallopoietes BAB-32]|uniref:DNA-(Apurinic or apyrimidinic site) lyase / pyrimidine dimer DNA glycosylase n=1 Tax=Arthrobacter crystallopoietes BAB-32 TaxID=1246476 RepID=N1UXV1_9MICC|nr:pyrimidine dimer DNA glycosylase/endonuclease V [Arthrobacter crystallopoietes]EMY32614.1 DNA-(apurinic or apyrimidinic site) lyase / pyrimidine dimer DNA glycosylase [Arthrobacter crystallopoietes BAB-32]
MRLWSLHPRYLDTKGLVACWRESLLAQKVLAGATKGYRNHPQLVRFRAAADPLAAVGAYLDGLAEEASTRGYRFNTSLILTPEPAAGVPAVPRLPVTEGQLVYEREHLLAKLAVRDPARREQLAPGTPTGLPAVHPLFTVVAGPVEEWERTG